MINYKLVNPMNYFVISTINHRIHATAHAIAGLGAPSCMKNRPAQDPEYLQFLISLGSFEVGSKVFATAPGMGSGSSGKVLRNPKKNGDMGILADV
jgi:hypothetical protein